MLVKRLLAERAGLKIKLKNLEILQKEEQKALDAVEKKLSPLIIQLSDTLCYDRESSQIVLSDAGTTIGVGITPDQIAVLHWVLHGEEPEEEDHSDDPRDQETSTLTGDPLDWAIKNAIGEATTLRLLLADVMKKQKELKATKSYCRLVDAGSRTVVTSGPLEHVRDAALEAIAADTEIKYVFELIDNSVRNKSRTVYSRRFFLGGNHG